jgi:hypothetical protein
MKKLLLLLQGNQYGPQTATGLDGQDYDINFQPSRVNQLPCFLSVSLKDATRKHVDMLSLTMSSCVTQGASALRGLSAGQLTP